MKSARILKLCLVAALLLGVGTAVTALTGWWQAVPPALFGARMTATMPLRVIAQPPVIRGISACVRLLLAEGSDAEPAMEEAGQGAAVAKEEPALARKNWCLPTAINVWSADPNQRTEQLMHASEALQKIKSEWNKFWFND